jgi:hypothetical protein
MPQDGPHCTALTMHPTSGECSTDRDCSYGSDDNDINSERYNDSYERREPIEGELVLDCSTTSHICGDGQAFIRYTQYTNRDERDIYDFAGTVAGKAIGYRDVRLRLRLPGYGRNHEVVVRNVLHIEGAHNLLSQSRLMDRGLWIVPVNGFGMKILDNARAESTGRGLGSLVGVARQIGG